ncbi:MAG TPA: zinc finger Ran-binding domain-containing protein, partial [Anaerolineales bacterium]|nr:zinc finger Ran-binding domain-containing protein [Anaerolineales bacterium]
MAEMITCPVCGTQNPANQAVCQRCQTPLNNALFQPGQSPVHKDTGELEPLLPQWLKDARQSAKEEGETQQQTQQPPKPEAPAKPAASSTDFLAGLQSQAGDDDDEEIPDWLASITGTSAPKQKPNEVVEEPSGTRWVETGNKSDFQQAEPEAEEEVPSWLTGMQQQPNPDEKDEL